MPPRGHEISKETGISTDQPQSNQPKAPKPYRFVPYPSHGRPTETAESRVQALATRSGAYGTRGYRNDASSSSHPELSQQAKQQKVPSSSRGETRSSHVPDSSVAGPDRSDRTHSDEGKETIATIDGRIDELNNEKLQEICETLSLYKKQSEKIIGKEIKDFAKNTHRDFQILNNYCSLATSGAIDDSSRLSALGAYNRLKEYYYNRGRFNDTVKKWYQEAGFNYAQDTQMADSPQQRDSDLGPLSGEAATSGIGQSLHDLPIQEADTHDDPEMAKFLSKKNLRRLFREFDINSLKEGGGANLESTISGKAHMFLHMKVLQKLADDKESYENAVNAYNAIKNAYNAIKNAYNDEIYNNALKKRCENLGFPFARK